MFSRAYRAAVTVPPLVWVTVFLLIPYLLMFCYSFWSVSMAQTVVHSRTLDNYRELLRRPRYVLLVLGYVGQTFTLGGFAIWAPTFLYRVHGMTLERAAWFFGLSLVATGLIATLLGGWLSTLWHKRNPAAYAWVLGLSTLAGAPVAFAAFALPDPGLARVMMVAAMGIVINGATAWLFFSGRKHDLNIKGAFLHMAADAAVSAGVVVAGVIIILTGWHWVDPIASLLINAVIVWGTWGLLRESLKLALDVVPRNVDLASVRGYLAGLPALPRCTIFTSGR